MRTQLVYDLPTRLFHWLFACLFITAFIIAKTVDSESINFSYHMLAGLTLGFIVILRIAWGFMGSRYSKFLSFALRPSDLISYFLGIFSGDKRRWAGHNPASSWAAIVMFALGLGLTITGYLMASGKKETFEDVHEVLANLFLLIVLGHIAGVILHGLRHRDGLAFSMINGQKSNDQAETISNSQPLVAVLFVALVAVFASYLLRNYDRQNQTLQFFGTSLSLGEKNEIPGGDKDNDD